MSVHVLSWHIQDTGYFVGWGDVHMRIHGVCVCVRVNVFVYEMHVHV